MTVGGRTLPSNPLHHEVQASVDYEAIEQAWTTERSSLAEQWKADVKTAPVAALVEEIQDSDTLDPLAALELPVLGEELLGDAMFSPYPRSNPRTNRSSAGQRAID